MINDAVKHRHIVWSGCLLVSLSLMVAACGSSSKQSAASGEPATTSGPTGPARGRQESTHADYASIAVVSSARLADGAIATRYTCRGADSSPPLTWAGVPAGAKELVVVVRTLSRGRLANNWVVAGLKPSLHHISAGKPPEGSVVARNSFGTVGYTLCPPTGTTAVIVMGLYAVPRKLNLRQGFEPSVLGEVAGAPGVAWGSVSALSRVHPITPG
jgi:phosphatidylethanolamine-binding protein (PEBP) family uncharacterized protein